MDEAVGVRAIATLDEAIAASALLDRIWGERRVMGAPLLRAMASHGGQVLGAFLGEELVGTLVGLVGLSDDGPVVHSHITGVAPEVQHRGVGFALKAAQRDWCLERGIEVVTWTFDPMVARNAHFNLVKLGAVAERFHRDYYGAMQDSFNAGDRSDRLEIVWRLRSERVAAAMEGRPDVEPKRDGDVLVEVPRDYHALRAEDPERARTLRDSVGDALERAFGDGMVAVGFRNGGYVLRPA